MAVEEFRLEDYLTDIGPEYADTVIYLHNFLIENGCGAKMKLAKSGHLVSYSDGKTKKVIANFVSRKKGPVIRIYGDYAHKYIDMPDTLTVGMIKSIDKAPACKLCNPKCMKGYDFAIRDARYLKCRYSCFMFEINAENSPYIKAILEHEISERTA